MKSVNDLIAQIKKGDLKPFYVFDGDEPYYIDELCEVFENEILAPHEKDFNLSIFYGKDADWSAIVNECRSYPAFAPRRVVILKEAAQLKDFLLLESYLQNPSPSTVFVIAYKYKKIDGRSKLASVVKSKGVYLTFSKLKDNQLSDWILSYCTKKNIKISAPNADLLAAYLGNDLQKIVNEIEKVLINVGDDRMITESLIEENIGISKEFNVFQFQEAILSRNTEQSFRIVNYYLANPKEGSPVAITATLYSKFVQVYQYHFAKGMPDKEVATALGMNPFFVKDIQRYARTFSLPQTIEAIELLHSYNLNALGMHTASNDTRLLKELTAKLLTL
ncbi:MAG: DNA polymerase III subunit delta [Bacteroidetes bacterium]|nr:DNA polymerase III subunit delta [Bacteroidota bacterium]